MNKKQQSIYATLETVADKANYLLKFEITAKPCFVGLDLVNKAFIGKIELPITGDSDDEVIKKAKAWLEEKAAA